jgi:glucose-6-phosphate-specific signal transduction histidine kinase
MLGMSLSTFTTVHVIISLVAIASGVIVLFGMLGSKRMNGLTALFLLTTVLTSVTGFGFPFTHLSPAHKLGIISLVVLAIAILARYSFHMAGSWRWIYVVTAAMALYLNVFVLVVQSFEKVPALHAMAPTQTEGPFKIAQLVVLVLFIVLTIAAVRKFHPQTPSSTH